MYKALLHGEQSIHNYPDMHREWGDDAHVGLRAAAARSARAAGAFPNHETSGWNSEYRAQLEDAMAVMADSRDVMKNLRQGGPQGGGRKGRLIKHFLL